MRGYLATRMNTISLMTLSLAKQITPVALQVSLHSYIGMRYSTWMELALWCLKPLGCYSVFHLKSRYQRTCAMRIAYIQGLHFSSVE